MNAGNLKYKITINLVNFVQETDFGSQNAANAPVLVWSSIKFIQAKEKIEGGIKENLQSAVFKFRFSPEVSRISERDNIVFDSITYNVKSLSFGGQSNREFIEILAQART